VNASSLTFKPFTVFESAKRLEELVAEQLLPTIAQDLKISEDELWIMPSTASESQPIDIAFMHRDIQVALLEVKSRVDADTHVFIRRQDLEHIRTMKVYLVFVVREEFMLLGDVQAVAGLGTRYLTSSSRGGDGYAYTFDYLRRKGFRNIPFDNGRLRLYRLRPPAN
jgi:hypothetical protein